MKRQTILFIGTCIIIASILTATGHYLLGQDLGNRYEGYLKINYYLNLNAFEEAEQLIDSYLESYPEDPYILTEKAFMVQNIANDPDKTLLLLNKALAVYPKYYYANYLKASLLFSQYPENKEKIDEAIKLLEISIEDSPDYYDSYYLMGLILSDREDYAGSNRYFEKANRLDVKLAVYYYMATNYHYLKDQAKEIEVYKKILSLDPENYKALRTLSQIYMEREEYQKSVGYLEKLFSGNPGTRKIAEEYLYSLFASGEHDKFMKITAAMNLDKSPLLIYGRAFILSRTKKLDEALKLLDRVEHKNPKLNLLLAEIYLLKKDACKAYQVLEKIEISKRDYFFYSLKLRIMLSLNLNQRIVKLFHQVRLDSAIVDRLSVDDFYVVLYAYANLNHLEMVHQVAKFAKSQLQEESKLIIELNEILKDFSLDKPVPIGESQSSISPNLYLILTLYKKQHQYKKAAAVVEAITAKLDKKEKDRAQGPYLELCDIYLLQEQYEKVENTLQGLLKKFPGSTSVKNFYAYYLALQNKNLPEALQLSAQTLDTDKDNPAYLDTYGYVLFKMDSLDQAEKYLKKAYDKHPFEEEIMEHLTEIYRKKNQLHKIKEMYQRAIDVGVDFKDKLLEKMGR